MVFLLLAKVLSSRVGFCSELCENVKLENVCSENKGGAKPSIKPFFWSSLCPPSLLHRTDLGTKSTNVWVDEGGGPGGGVEAHTIQLKELWKNNMWDSDKSHLSYQIMLKPMSTASKDLVLLKQTDYTMTDKCPSNSRSPNVADNADGADEADDVDGGVREQAERLSQERKQVVALSDGLGSWKTGNASIRNMSHLWRGSQKRAFRWLAKLSLVPVDKLTW